MDVLRTFITDHPGVPNAQLLNEDTRLAQIYKKSIAEQNSVDLVWQMLMAPTYKDLRGCIYSNLEELQRFRQLVVNTVMATDIADKELQALRKNRWEQAFNGMEELNPVLDMNRKATIVIEHLIQASDVSHPMQHWKLYKRWNEHFFFECYSAYRTGRAEKVRRCIVRAARRFLLLIFIRFSDDLPSCAFCFFSTYPSLFFQDPSVGWYKGEIGFFDFYSEFLLLLYPCFGSFSTYSTNFLRLFVSSYSSKSTILF